MSAEFLTITAAVSTQITEKKSRFIAYAVPISHEKEAQDFISSIKTQYHDARHHVYAYIVDEQLRRSFDDGEPSGTAGKPILEVLDKAGLIQTMIVVVRYFGGVLLGTGSLTRAYGKAAALAIEQATMIKKRSAHKYSLNFDYPYVEKITAYLARKGWSIEQKNFTQAVSFIVLVERGKEQIMASELANITQGSLVLHDLGLDGYLVSEV
ncbi:MAG: YigZ family protein [Bacillota bacterium]|jgi:uncharacterized YigZ family protein